MGVSVGSKRKHRPPTPSRNPWRVRGAELVGGARQHTRDVSATDGAGTMYLEQQGGGLTAGEREKECETGLQVSHSRIPSGTTWYPRGTRVWVCLFDSDECPWRVSPAVAASDPVVSEIRYPSTVQDLASCGIAHLVLGRTPAKTHCWPLIQPLWKPPLPISARCVDLRTTGSL